MANAVPVPPPTTQDWVRFFSKVNTQTETGCWEWVGGRFTNGYGMFALDGKARRAHRILWVWLNGEHDAPGLDHICDNRACVNPNHLRPATTKENVLRGDGYSARNARKTHCLRGHDDWRVDPRSGMRICRVCVRDRNRERYRRLTGLPEERYRKP